jgi:hypothetical protein
MLSPAQRILEQQKELESKAQVFLARTNYTLQEVLGRGGEILRSAATRSRVAVETVDPRGLSLKVNGEDIFRLKLRYQCELSESKDFLAVQSSTFRLFHKDVTEPILHFDYNNKPTGSIPAAHINVHTESEGFKRALEDSGDARRAKQRRKSSGDGKPSQLHLPVGGPRFRPCLEDVLEMIIQEFGVDVPDEWRTSIHEGRVIWRELQLKAAVTDQPEAAAEALRGLGYVVHWDKPEPPTWRLPRLQAY